MLFKIKKLIVTRGNKIITNEVSFDVERGSWMGVIGANGSGKTTLLHAISGRTHIKSGEIYLSNIDHSSERETLASKIGFCCNIYDLPDQLTANQLIELIQGEQVEKYAFLKTLLGFKSFDGRLIGELSSGTKQKVALYLAFLNDPELIILDEPFNWLDPVVAFDLKHAFRRLTKDGLTLITALHDISTFTQYCTHGMLLSAEKPPLIIEAQMLQLGRRDVAGFEERIITQLRGDLSH